MQLAANGGGLPLHRWHNDAGVILSLHFHIAATAIVFALMLTALPQVHACGLEPTLRGGITVSHPGAIDVAMAVAAARRDGLLPPADARTVSNDVRLRQMLADLRRLQSRLNEGRAQDKGDSKLPFSLVLVGPGLWSHYHMTAGGVEADFHTVGPLEGKAVVMTHSVVLRALLDGTLTTDQAAEFGLLAYSGNDTGPVREVLEAGFQSSS